MNQTTLLRYNFRVLMLNNWWLLVFPLAVSQLSVFWNVLTQRFTLGMPAQTVEMITPLVAAFLGAHLLSAEYRSRIGAVLASRPVNISRIVVMRLAVMLALVWGLGMLSLLAYSSWMQPFDMKPVILAAIPSTLFLTMLALTFATLFRNSLAGFGVAAAYWALDLPGGAPLHPYLSLRSLTSYYGVLTEPDRQTFTNSWWIAKVILLIAAFALYLYHSRLVFTLGSPQTLRSRRRALVSAGAVVVLYLVSGAAIKVGYGYQRLGRLSPDDPSWFRYQFAPYGPIPVAALFGPAFTRYLGEFNNPWRLQQDEESDRWGDTVKHRKDLREIVDKMPSSVWAASAADALARLEARRQTNVDNAVPYYRTIVDRFPNSPYVALAQRQIARAYADAQRVDEARTAYGDLLRRFPNSPHRAEAIRYLVESERKAGRPAEAARWAEQWTTSAPTEEKFEAWITLAEIRKDLGDAPGAKQAAKETLAAVEQYRRAIESKEINPSPSSKLKQEDAAYKAEQQAKKMLTP
jgi:tetratricopeptide (TPR) repeat protein